MKIRRLLLIGLILLSGPSGFRSSNTSVAQDFKADRGTPPEVRRLLYVGSPGVRNYVRWGGQGVLVFDIDDGHRFVKRISLAGYGTDEQGKVLNIKGIAASTKRGGCISARLGI